MKSFLDLRSKRAESKSTSTGCAGKVCIDVAIVHLFMLFVFFLYRTKDFKDFNLY